MRINISKEKSIKEIIIKRNENEETYKLLIDGEEFNIECNKCKNLEIGFDILEDTKIKTIERKELIK